MSITKRKLEEQEEQENASKWMKYLLESDSLDNDIAKGIAKQIITKGLNSLSDKQKSVYQNYILPLTQRHCDCGANLEVEDVEEDDGLCSYCRYKLSKND